MEQNNQKVVLITGITGYMAAWVLKYALEQFPENEWKIRGSARSKTGPKIESLKKAIGEENFSRVELVEVDLNKAESLEAALEGVHTCIHTASPFNPAEFTKYEDFVNPVKEGTKALLEAIEKHGVKKLVLTCSVVAIVTDFQLGAGVDVVYDETIYAKTDGTSGYADSKIIEEEIIRDFMKEKKDVEIYVLNPGLIMGPLLIDQNSQSSQMLQGLMTGAMPDMPDVNSPFVDVRDCAQAHINAVLRNNLSHNRFILSQGEIRFPELAQILSDEYAKYGYPVTTKVVEDPSTLNTMMRQYHGKSYKMNNELSQKVLGVEYKRTIPDVLKEMVQSLIEMKMLENKIQ